MMNNEDGRGGSGEEYNDDDFNFDIAEEDERCMSYFWSPQYSERYSMEDQRRKSFENSLIQCDQATTSLLAKAGFFAIQQTETLKCFSCYIEYNFRKISSLETIQSLFIDPFNFHRAENPNCAFISSYIHPRSKCIKSLKSFYYEQERLESFDSWPIPWINPKSLAENGFYYLKHKDKVACIFCGIIINKWLIDDDIEKKHQSNSLGCPLLLNKNFGKNIPIKVSNLLKSLSSTHLYPIPNRKECEWVINENQKRKAHAYKDSNGLYNIEPIREDFSCSNDRFNTFFTQSWPRDKAYQDTYALANAGFFYSGIGDIVLCYHCLGGLKNFELNDDPLKLHAKYYPHCSFILMNPKVEEMRGGNNNNWSHDKEISKSNLDKIIKHMNLKELCKNVDVLRNVVLTKLNTGDGVPIIRENDIIRKDENEQQQQQQQPSSSSEKFSYPLLPLPSPSSSSSSSVPTISEECKYKCKICFDYDIQIVFYPCNHMTTCYKCFKKMSEISNYQYNNLFCPYCQTPIKKFSVPYL